MFHVCVQRFDVTKNLEKFCKILETKPTPKGRWTSRNLVGSDAAPSDEPDATNH